MDRLKQKQYLIYNCYTLDNEEYVTKEIELKVICKERFGEELVAKCKVITKNWYEKEVYITAQDLYSGRVKILDSRAS